MSDGCIRSVENLRYDSDDAKGSLTHTHTHVRRHTHHDHNVRGERYRSDKNYTLNKGGIYVQIMKFLHRNPVNLDTNTHTHTVLTVVASCSHR